MTEIKNPIILEGPAFDWEAGKRHSANAVDSDGNVNWHSAMFADPGIMKCEKCGVYLWQEGYKVRCPDCGHEFETRNRRPG